MYKNLKLQKCAPKSPNYIDHQRFFSNWLSLLIGMLGILFYLFDSAMFCLNQPRTISLGFVTLVTALLVIIQFSIDLKFRFFELIFIIGAVILFFVSFLFSSFALALIFVLLLTLHFTSRFSNYRVDAVSYRYKTTIRQAMAQNFMVLLILGGGVSLFFIIDSYPLSLSLLFGALRQKHFESLIVIDANFFASVFFPGSILLYFGSPRVLKYLMLTVFAIVFYLSISRGFLLGLICTFIMFYFVNSRFTKLSKKKKIWFAKIVAILIVALIPFSPNIIFSILSNFPSIHSLVSSEYRHSSDINRFEKIVSVQDYIINDLFFIGLKDYEAFSPKPHNFFWQFALLNGLFAAMVLNLILVVFLLLLPVTLSCLLFGLIVFGAFLDFAIIFRSVLFWIFFLMLFKRSSLKI